MKKSTLVIIFFISLVSNLFAQEKRIALVIGNSDYSNGTNLKNPVNDAELMSSTLENLGFEVIKQINATKVNMEKSMYEFSKKLKDYNVALFYFAGHGILVEGVNYLIPTDATLNEKLSTQFEAVDVSKLVAQFEEHPENINIVVLDACRNNPYRSWSRGAERGFKPIPAPSGTIIAYATSIGAGALDGEGQNGLYTAKLVEQMKIPQRIEDVFIKTRVAVRKESMNGQSPQEWSQLTGAFYFKDDLTASNSIQPDLGIAKELTYYGDILLTTELSGKLHLDGRYIGGVVANTETPINKLKVGFHELEIKGGDGWKSKVYVKKEETINVNATLTNAALKYKEQLKFKVDLGVSIDKLFEEEYTILEILEAGLNEKDFYGQKFKGGKIFYINKEDGSGLVAASNDQKDGIGISWNQAKDVAKAYKGDNYSDWYLPSKDELNLIYLNLRKNNEGSLSNGNYWSSTVGERTTVAWRQEFSTGYQYENYNYLKYNVRAIRAFKSKTTEPKLLNIAD